MIKQKMNIFLFFSLISFSFILYSPAPCAMDLNYPGDRLTGYLYESSHDEIVSKARKEGKLRALLGFDPASITALQRAFSKKYPFIDAYFEEITGTDAAARFLLELQSGRSADWDLFFLYADNYEPLRPFVEKFDLLTMAQKKILDIPPAMIDPKDRNVLSLGTTADIAAYNSKLLKATDVPTTWEGFLQPQFKDRKFVLDVMPRYLAGLVPLMGMEWAQDYARKLAAQNPIWSRGQTRVLTAMAAGEYALTLGTYYHTVMRARQKGMANLAPVFVEPVSIRIGDIHGVRKDAKHPHTALLLLEFIATPEGQQILDDTNPGKASVYASRSMLAEAIAGRKLSVLDWTHLAKRGSYDDALFKALGFPTVKGKKK